MDKTKRYGSLEAIQNTNFIDEEVIAFDFVFRGMPCRLIAGYDDNSNLAFFLRWGEDVGQIGEIISLSDYKDKVLKEAERDHIGEGNFYGHLNEDEYCNETAFQEAARNLLKWDLSCLSKHPNVVRVLKKYLLFVYLKYASEAIHNALGLPGDRKKPLIWIWKNEKDRKELAELADSITVALPSQSDNPPDAIESTGSGAASNLTSGFATGCGCLIIIIVLALCFSGC